MLIKKQLVELAKNYGMKINPDDMPAVVAARAALAYREMLEKLEWIETSFHGLSFCPVCKKTVEHGHAEGCALAKLLEER